MASGGYSGTPLIQKLGIKPDMKVMLLNAPSDYFRLLGEDISSQVVKSGAAGLVHLFATEAAILREEFTKLINEMPAGVIIWISWYKKASRQPTDINEDIIRDIVLPLGWVDIKVCSVSEQWSGLKIVKRKAAR